MMHIRSHSLTYADIDVMSLILRLFPFTSSYIHYQKQILEPNDELLKLKTIEANGKMFQDS